MYTSSNTPNNVSAKRALRGVKKSRLGDKTSGG